MNNNSDKLIEEMKRKVEYYQKINIRCHEALQNVEEFVNTKTSLNKMDSVEEILEGAYKKISGRINFIKSAFYLVNETTSEFNLCKCWPTNSISFFETNFEKLIENGNIAWIMRERKGQHIPYGTKESTLFMHSITTMSRARGFFIGLLQNGGKDITFIDDSMITLILQQCAHSIESFELYKLLRKKNEKLDQLYESKSKQFDFKMNFEQLLSEISTQFINITNENIAASVEKALISLGNFINADSTFLFTFKTVEAFNLTSISNTQHYKNSTSCHIINMQQNSFPYLLTLIKTNEPFIVEFDKTNPLLSEFEKKFFLQQNTKEIVIVPIISEGKLNGIFGFNFHKNINKWNEDLGNLMKITGEIFINAFNRVKMGINLEKSREQLRFSQKMEAIGKLAGGLAHDFNNILTAINGHVELFIISQKGLFDDNSKLKQILKASERGAGLTKQLLAVSKTQFIKPENIEVNAMIRDMYKMMLRLVEEDIKMELNLHESPIYIKADKSQIDQLIMNLVVNARDAINEKESSLSNNKFIKLKTSTMLIDENNTKDWFINENGEYLLIEITDSGKGMSKETCSRIFEPFFTTKGFEKGTGLGLATVYGIIRQNNGCIKVDSQLNMGTVFKILWPLVHNGVTNIAEEDSPSEIRGGKETILIAEDDPSVLESLSESLKIIGYNVIKAKDGHVALEKFAEEKQIDLIISDNKMPGINGKDLIERLKKNHPDLKAILTSGYTDSSPQTLKMIDKFVFVQKPYTIKEIIDIIHELLD